VLSTLFLPRGIAGLATAWRERLARGGAGRLAVTPAKAGGTPTGGAPALGFGSASPQPATAATSLPSVSPTSATPRAAASGEVA
jgi:hypothetical protein